MATHEYAAIWADVRAAALAAPAAATSSAGPAGSPPDETTLAGALRGRRRRRAGRRRARLRTALQWVAKPLLAPLLPGPAAGVRRRWDLVAAGLVCATAGDVALLLPGDTAFLAGMGCFLGTQVCFLTAFLRAPAAAGGGLRRLPGAVGGANALLWGRLGDLRLPVLGYSLALSLMAAAAAGVSRRAAAGGALFLASDLLIGVGAAGAQFPGRGLLVMVTYIAALFLLTTAWAGRGATDRRPAPTRPPAPVRAAPGEA